MLVLSRKKSESIMIGSQIEVQVLRVKGNVVKLGVKAPDHVKILRGEVSPFDVTFEISLDEFSEESKPDAGTPIPTNMLSNNSLGNSSHEGAA
ncbi:MAG: carbon storage regulator [Planctomycetota bacterium]